MAERYRELGDMDLYAIALTDAVEADPDLIFAMYYERIVELLQYPEEYWNYVRLFGSPNPRQPLPLTWGVS